MILTDDSKMPVGAEHRGEKMINIPARYFLWVWDQDHLRANPAWKPVFDYIKDNMRALVHEANHAP